MTWEHCGFVWGKWQPGSDPGPGDDDLNIFMTETKDIFESPAR